MEGAFLLRCLDVFGKRDSCSDTGAILCKNLRSHAGIKAGMRLNCADKFTKERDQEESSFLLIHIIHA